jgi:lipopolysaccharide transport system ATP-binding protein
MGVRLLSDIIIAVESLSKRYLVGHQSAQPGYVTLRDMVGREVRNFMRKAADFVHGRQIVQGDEVEEFWALKDVSFEVKRGEVLGIVGRNGAGKSTLLKILSRITEPDGGRAILRGRVASLLEVGTGFHPELTGRENIFLNGAILGMSRAEIIRKFDKIVAFAEVDRFLDTPVKHYSSGMYVRLAFAVAAHLEPEILVIDEVLAVGDAEFQKKCLGKMDEVARGGRTVLFVSHNMAAFKGLTSRGILLDAGRVAFSGASEQVIQRYTQMTKSPKVDNANWGKGAHTVIRDVCLFDKNGLQTTQYIPGEPLNIEVVFDTDGSRGMSLEIFLTDATATRLGLISTYQFYGRSLPQREGRYRTRIKLNPLWLASGNYGFDVATSIVNSDWDHVVESAVQFNVQFVSGYAWDFKQSYGYGSLAMLCQSTPDFTSLYDRSGANKVSKEARVRRER